jgi:hypothetical protein
MQLWELIEALTAPGIDRDADTNVINLRINRCHKDGRTVVVVDTVPMVADDPEDPPEMVPGWTTSKVRDLLPALTALPVEPSCSVVGLESDKVATTAELFVGGARSPRRFVMLK